MCVSKTLVICHPWLLARSRYTCGSSEASITMASSPAPMRYERQPFPVRRTWMTRTSFAGTGTSAVFQARLQAFMPPSRDRACNPRACSCEAAIWLVFPAAHTVTTGPSLGASTSASAAGLCARRASYASTWILPGMAHSAHSAVGRTSRIVTGRLSSNHTLKVSTSMVIMLSSCSTFNWQPQSSPVRKPLFESACIVPVRTQQGNRLIGKHTIGTATVGDNLLVLRKLWEASLQVGHRNRDGVGKMRSLVFLYGTHVQQDDIPLDQALAQLQSTDRLQQGSLVQVALDNAIDLSNASLPYIAHGLPQAEHALVRQAIVDVDALAAHVDQLSGSQHL